MLAAMVAAAWPARAATEVLYVEQTGHYVRGVFRDFWDKNGGLPNFGFPITEEFVDPATGRIFQFFERARFERATAADTNVTLTELGRIYLGNRTFPKANPIRTTAQRRYIPETGYIIQYGFKEIWETRGGERIFGNPLSNEVTEQLADGRSYTVQYFARVRFEFRPNLPAGQRVVISDLGRYFVPPALLPPLPPNSPPPGPIVLTGPAPTTAPPTATPRPGVPAPTPTPAPASPGLGRPAVPASVNSRVVPQAGTLNGTFTFEATGFQANERVAVWLNVPDKTTVAYKQYTADARGAISGITFQSQANSPLGVYSFVGQGVSSKRTAIGYFALLGSVIGRSPPPPQGVPADVNAGVEPRAGPIGTVFFLDASGFRPNEEVQVIVIASDGRRTEATFTVTADARGSIGYAGVYYLAPQGASLGLYSFVATGKTSTAQATGYFVLTP
jgi:hypothetical protein